MNQDHDPLQRMAERGDPRGAEHVWATATAEASHARNRRQLGLALIVAATFIVVAATASTLMAGDDPSSVRTAASNSSTATDAPTSTADRDNSTTTPSTTTETTAPTTDDLPGERVEGPPWEGLETGVAGVRTDDHLNVRNIPGIEGKIIAELSPLATGIVPTGHNRRLPDDSYWAEVTVNETTGWVNTDYLGYIGRPSEVTNQFYPDRTQRPSAPTMGRLAERVLEDLRSSSSAHLEVTLVAGPSESPPEFTVDVTGLQDDSGLGLRYRFLAEPSGSQFIVATVEETQLCRRGVSDDGVCV